MSQLYNRKPDPTQGSNLIEKNIGEARELHQILVKFIRETEVPERLLAPRLELRM